MVSELSEAVDKLEVFDGSILIIKGEGNTFCSGADLSTAQQFFNDNNSKIGMCALMQDSLTRIKNLPLLTIASIEGYAIGGGAEITTVADFRIMSEKAKIQFVHAKLGLCPGWGGASRLLRIIGRNKALKILCSSEPITFENGRKLGFIDDVSEENKCMESNSHKIRIETLEFCKHFSDNSINSIRSIKQMISYGEEHPIDSKLLENDRMIFSKLWVSESHKSAFSKNPVLLNHLNKPNNI